MCISKISTPNLIAYACLHIIGISSAHVKYNATIYVVLLCALYKYFLCSPSKKPKIQVSTEDIKDDPYVIFLFTSDETSDAIYCFTRSSAYQEKPSYTWLCVYNQEKTLLYIYLVVCVSAL